LSQSVKAQPVKKTKITMVSASLNEQAFAAVEQFFGEESTPVSATATATAPPLPPPRTSGRRPVSEKAGLGSKTQLTTQLLRVGTKRKTASEESDNVSEPDKDEEDEDDEVGRTAAGSISRAATTAASPRSTKMGKKERLRAKTESAVTAVSIDAPSMAEKKRRKKVRSRQKNIRKDHRTEKPAHLQMHAAAEYRGRPLTPATRLVLNLPPPRTSLHHDLASVPGVATLQQSSGLPPINWMPPKPSRHPVVQNDDHVVIPAAQDPPVEKTEARKKRSKYKNLQ
jgi:hypothetical protein